MTLSLFSRHGFAIAAALFPLIVLIIAVTYCITGYLIAQRRRSGARLGVIVATLTSSLSAVDHSYASYHVSPVPMRSRSPLLLILLAARLAAQ